MPLYPSPTHPGGETIAPATDVPGLSVHVPNLGGPDYTSNALEVKDHTGAVTFGVQENGNIAAGGLSLTAIATDTLYDAAGVTPWASVSDVAGSLALYLPGVLTEQAAPSSPPAGQLAVYAGTDHALHVKTSGGTDTALGSGGGGNTTYTNAYSSPPASPTNGDQWYPSDGVGIHFVRTGGAWAPYYAGYPLSDPTTPSWSWVNQGSATVATSGGGLFLQGASVSGENWQVRAVSAPSRPYTRTAAILPRFDTGGYEIGIGFRESGTGKLHMFFVYASGGDVVLYSSLFSSATNWSGTHYTSATLRWLGMQPLWLQISDDNTNRICRYSMDGQHWKAFHTVTRLDYLTGGADQVVWGVNSNNTAPAATLISWG